MGKVLSVVTRPLRNFNIESRAHKVIAKEKPVPAPLHEANIKEAEKLLQENPETFTELMKKDSDLETRLKDVYVKSYDPKDTSLNIKITENPDRPLPLNRKIIQFQELGYLEPKNITPGKITLRKVLQILSIHQSDPEKWDSAREALNHNISEENIKNIIQYFRVYHVFVPDKKSRIAYGAPKIPRKRIAAGKESNEL